MFALLPFRGKLAIVHHILAGHIHARAGHSSSEPLHSWLSCHFFAVESVALVPRCHANMLKQQT